MAGRFDLDGQTAIVTGGGWGIGEAIARALSDQGAAVAIADIAAERAERVAGEIEAAGGRAFPVAVDVVDEMAVERLFDETIARFGGVEILVNNAGGLRGRGRTVDLSLDDWRFTMDLTVTSAFLCSRRAGREMIPRGRGAIVNIASIYGLIGYDTALYEPRAEGTLPESIAYAAGKGAMIAMTRTLAGYWAPYDIRVNAVAPGPTRTERLGVEVAEEVWNRFAARTMLGRPAVPDDVAGAVVYLASDAARNVTGQVIAVDGGWTAW